ncbi:MAG: DUF424 domain-containing protein [Candidatus Nanoarchaeia archaeon]
MIVNVIDSDKGVIVVVCDEDLLGKLFDEGQAQLDLTSDFYKGKKYTPVEAADIMRNADTLNLVGEKAVQLGVDEGMIDKNHVLKVAGVPHAEFSRL